ncbi:MAG: hypothetical protein HRU41_00610 [Saprospiraceae bacterium]|nr:hypothetical protein [Saprospiraceae bacterium]
MSVRKDETASFMLRFTQKIFNNESGEPQVQWRGNIRHVQGGEEQRFSKFDDVVAFIQSKLADLTIQAMEDKPIEEQKGILSKSFDMWKKMAVEGPKMVMETIKDPKKGMAQIQDQIQDLSHQVKDEISQKLEIDTWKTASKSDFKEIMQKLTDISAEVSALNAKVDQLTQNQQ